MAERLVDQLKSQPMANTFDHFYKVPGYALRFASKWKESRSECAS
jgi:hypothetical protein